jgi:hypothetical protein
MHKLSIMHVLVNYNVINFFSILHNKNEFLFIQTFLLLATMQSKHFKYLVSYANQLFVSQKCTIFIFSMDH